MPVRLPPLVEAFAANRRLFVNVLDGITPRGWVWRPEGPGGSGNHMAFLACHLSGARFFTLKMVGDPRPDPLSPLVGGNRTIDEIETWPTRDEVLDAWDQAAEGFGDRIAGLDDEMMKQPAGLPFPAEGPTLFDALVFLARHEAYHLGQMGLLRRLLGRPEVRWR